LWLRAITAELGAGAELGRDLGVALSIAVALPAIFPNLTNRMKVTAAGAESGAVWVQAHIAQCMVEFVA